MKAEDIRKELKKIGKVNGHKNLQILQYQLTLNTKAIASLHEKVDEMFPIIKVNKQKADTNRWLIGIILVGIIGIAFKIFSG